MNDEKKAGAGAQNATGGAQKANESMRKGNAQPAQKDSAQESRVNMPAAPVIAPKRGQAIRLFEARWRCPTVSAEEMREAIEDFRVIRGTEDLQQTDLRYFAPLLEQWQCVINAADCSSYSFAEGGETGDGEEVAQLSADFVRNSVIAMNESMAMRDSLLLSIVSNLTWDELIQVGVYPSRSQTARLVASTLGEVFHSHRTHPDPRRILLSQKLLNCIQGAVPQALSAQPDAMLAYVDWWAGEYHDALKFARMAIDADPSCTLPTIIIRAVEHGVYPAWCRGERQ